MYDVYKLDRKLNESLIDAVLEQIKKDVRDGDLTAIEELLIRLPHHRLVGYLPEDQWINHPKEQDDVQVWHHRPRKVDLQYDDATAEELQNILLDAAELFGIEVNEMILNEDPETGEIRIRFKEDKLEEPAVKKTGWTPKVISNENTKDDKSD